MIIKNIAELSLFETAVNRCRNAVLVLTPEGKQYDLKKPSEFIKGIAELMKQRRDHLESEIFTNCIDDEMNIFDYITASRALSVA